MYQIFLTQIYIYIYIYIYILRATTHSPLNAKPLPDQGWISVNRILVNTFLARMNTKITFAKWQPYCLSLNVFTYWFLCKQQFATYFQQIAMWHWRWVRCFPRPPLKWKSHQTRVTTCSCIVVYRQTCRMIRKVKRGPCRLVQSDVVPLFRPL